MGYLILVLGVMITAFGVPAVICLGSYYKLSGKTILLSCLLTIVSGGLLSVFATPSKDYPNGSPTAVVLGFIGLMASTAMIISNIMKNNVAKKEKEQRGAESIGETTLDRFFVECVLADANDFSIPKNVQRAQLLANKYKLGYPNGIQKLYAQGLEGHKKVTEIFKSNLIEEQRAQERDQYVKLNKYADLIGKDKPIAMLRDKASQLRKEAEAAVELADMWMSSGQQKERDWATWGGIAEGIGGIGAGIATAVDIQMENMQIRKENEQRKQAVLPEYKNLMELANKNTRKADMAMHEIELLNLKLISDDPKEKLLERISFSNTKVQVTETGAAMVSTSATLDSNFTIFDDVPAIVDGTIIAKVYDGDKLCGRAQLVLPVNGLGQNIKLNGISPTGYHLNKKYSVKFEARNLWAMEK